MAEDKIVKDFFDGIANDWGKRAYDNQNTSLKFPSSKVRHGITIDELKKRKTNGSVLDMGCASGELVIDLLKLGFDAKGFDISPKMIEKARQNLSQQKELSSVAGDNIFWSGDFTSFESKDKFDCITAMGFTEYLDDDCLFFDKAKSFLKEDGYVIVDFRNKLFNLFSGNQHTVELSKKLLTEDFVKQLDSLEKYSPLKTGDAVNILFDYYNKVGKELKQIENMEHGYKDPEYKLIATQIDLRQSTPELVEKQAKESGLEMEYVVYFHFHPFLPMYEKYFSVLYNTIGMLIQPLGYTPLGASTCSSFVAVLKNKSSN